MTEPAPMDAVVLLTGHAVHPGAGVVALPAAEKKPIGQAAQAEPLPYPAGHMLTARWGVWRVEGMGWPNRWRVMAF